MAGTDVAREAADIVLTDDDFATIGSAIEEGRRIFTNIRRFGQFLFSFHLAVVLVVTSGIAMGLASPIAGLMVLWNNLIIDVIPSFALALEPGRGDSMREPPRPKGECRRPHGPAALCSGPAPSVASSCRGHWSPPLALRPTSSP